MMGNSPSQQIAEGAQGEPEDFDLNAISDGSGDNRMPSKKKKKKSPQATSKSKARKLRSSANTLKPSSVNASPLEERDQLPAPAKATEMKGLLETSDDDSPDVIPVSPVLRASQTKKTRGFKRRRASSFVAETPIEKPRKRQKNGSSPATSAELVKKNLGQESATANESLPGQAGSGHSSRMQNLLLQRQQQSHDPHHDSRLSQMCFRRMKMFPVIPMSKGARVLRKWTNHHVDGA